MGHGRSLSVGRGDKNQHVDAIQTENLILRVMGIPYINTGADHAPNGAFPGCSLLPSFRWWEDFQRYFYLCSLFLFCLLIVQQMLVVTLMAMRVNGYKP